jgi:hypothetical protein
MLIKNNSPPFGPPRWPILHECQVDIRLKAKRREQPARLILYAPVGNQWGDRQFCLISGGRVVVSLGVGVAITNRAKPLYGFPWNRHCWFLLIE